jgi:hypothetical protein
VALLWSFYPKNFKFDDHPCHEPDEYDPECGFTDSIYPASLMQGQNQRAKGRSHCSGE